MAGKDYYKVLGVDKSASKEDIKKAFRKAALEHHPDKGGNAEKFKEANEAYGVLSDDQKRAQYDSYGSAGPGAGGFGGGQQYNASDFGFDFSGFNQGNGQGFEFDLGDIFGDVFGGAAGGRKAQARRGRDITMDIELSFHESVFGAQKEIRLTKQSTCKDCSGTGAKAGTAMTTCTVCGGAGKVREAKRSMFGTFMSEHVCENCSGSGKIPKEKCPTCRGAGTVHREDIFTVTIPEDIDDGQTLRMPGAGEAIKGGSAGDLYIKVHVKKDSLLKKEGKNLVTELNVKLTDALLGAKYSVKTLDGDIELVVPDGADFGQVLRVKGKGVPYGNGKRGDLLVKLNIKIPTKLSKKAKQAIEEMKGEGI